jgi:AraC-like DNA-binding protein
MKIYIKYMVSYRCVLKVKEVLSSLGIEYTVVNLGSVHLRDEISERHRQDLNSSLKNYGLEILSNKKTILVEQIKVKIIEMIHYADELPKVNYSDVLSKELGYDYTYLANLFSEVKGITIKQYIISNRIEKIKELLMYDELTLTEIADRLHYNSISHLSNQFKKVTGLAPSFYRSVAEKRRLMLENL